MRQPTTREKRAEYVQRYVEKRTRRALDYLGGECVVCGSTTRLDFDHIVPASKVCEISTVIRSGYWSWERLVVELDKCQLLCRPHHDEKSSREARAKVTHGKYHAAYHLHCPCGECAQFKIERNASRRVARMRM